MACSQPPRRARPVPRAPGRGRGPRSRITSPHIQKTGLALAGFHEYLRPGRVLIFGESEIRYLESLDAAARLRTAAPGADARFSLRPHHRRLHASAGGRVEAERAELPLLKTPVATPTAIAKLTSILEDSLAERTVMHAVLHGHPRPRRADRRRERHRQERVRARPDRPRPPARRRRHGRSPPARRRRSSSAPVPS